MGCRTATPACDAMRPVIMGKKQPPICAKTNTNVKAVEWMRGENNLAPTDMPFIVNQSVSQLIRLLSKASSEMNEQENIQSQRKVP